MSWNFCVYKCFFAIVCKAREKLLCTYVQNWIYNIHHGSWNIQYAGGNVNKSAVWKIIIHSMNAEKNVLSLTK